jgi:two-component system response regulator FixJ
LICRKFCGTELHARTSIAISLNISPRTVEIYRAKLMGKMQASSLSELVRFAVRAGIA